MQMKSLAFGSLTWGTPCFSHEPPSSRGRYQWGNLPVPPGPFPIHRPETGR
jgi:hypothetical protein